MFSPKFLRATLTIHFLIVAAHAQEPSLVPESQFIAELNALDANQFRLENLFKRSERFPLIDSFEFPREQRSFVTPIEGGPRLLDQLGIRSGSEVADGSERAELSWMGELGVPSSERRLSLGRDSMNYLSEGPYVFSKPVLNGDDKSLSYLMADPRSKRVKAILSLNSDNSQLARIVPMVPKKPISIPFFAPKQSLPMKLLNDSISLDDVRAMLAAGAPVEGVVEDPIEVVKGPGFEKGMARSVYYDGDISRLSRIRADRSQELQFNPNFHLCVDKLSPIAASVLSCREDITLLLIEKGVKLDSKFNVQSGKGCIEGQSNAPVQEVTLEQLVDLRERVAKEYYQGLPAEERNVAPRSSRAQEALEVWHACNTTNKTLSRHIRIRSNDFSPTELAVEHGNATTNRFKKAKNANGRSVAEQPNHSEGMVPLSAGGSSRPVAEEPTPKFPSLSQEIKAQQDAAEQKALKDAADLKAMSEEHGKATTNRFKKSKGK